MSRCFIFGTFDVENYGDLLFPHVASWRLAQQGIQVIPVSPTNVRTRYHDALQPLSVAECFSATDAGCGVLIGGGNIIHNLPTRLPDYVDREGTATWGYAALWLGATLFGAVRDVPIAWNAPGVPSATGPERLQGLIQSAVAAADYCSVRDQASRDYLGGASSIQIVLDSATDISRVWPREKLRPAFHALLEREAADSSRRYFAVHVKERSLDSSLEELATAITAVARGGEMTPILLAIGLCHGDGLLARRLARYLPVESIVVDAPQSLQEVASVLAWSDCFVGSSLHGYITSYSYGTPAVLVARPKLPKFDGYLQLIGRPQDRVETWAAGLLLAGERCRYPSKRDAELPLAIIDVLDQHWAAVTQALASSASNHDRRTAFLRSTTRQGMADHGPAWSLRPFLA